jgi:hypothetical protein
MKSKMTLAIDKELIPQSKKYAKKRGISVSQLVEELLRESIQNDRPSFSTRWRGKFKVVEKDDAKFAKLKGRYL